MTYSATKVEAATCNRLGGDTFTRDVTDGQTTDRLCYEINTLFSNEKKADIKMHMNAKINEKRCFVR